MMLIDWQGRASSIRYHAQCFQQDTGLAASGPEMWDLLRWSAWWADRQLGQWSEPAKLPAGEEKP